MRRALCWLALVALCLPLVLAPSGADARIKLDRYTPASMPEGHLWVTLLDEGGAPMYLPEQHILDLLVKIPGQEFRGDEVSFTTADEHGRPRSVALVLDTRGPGTWPIVREAIKPLLTELPSDSKVLTYLVGHPEARIPEEKGWLDEAEAMVGALGAKETGVLDPYLLSTIRDALRDHPMAPGLIHDPESDGPLPKMSKEEAEAFPTDRILYVISDAEFEEELKGASTGRHLRELVFVARRRGVRIMTIGIPSELTLSQQWILRVLARKTGGSHRQAVIQEDLRTLIKQAAEEISRRLIITVEMGERLRPGDVARFSVTATLAGGQAENTLPFDARLAHEMGFFEGLIDTASDVWELWPWWARALVYAGFGLVGGIILLIVVIKKRRAAAAEAEAAAQAKAEALASRTPCGVCGRMMMPDWTECLFCAQSQAAEVAMRFRLVGRSGTWQGQVLRFNKDVVVLGSGDRCDVRLRERGVAQEHCGVRDRGGAEFILTDFNSATGTTVNGQRITQVPLREGDLIAFGDSEFVFGIEAQASDDVW